MNLPTQISPCPIVDAVIEIRFNSALPEDAVFGQVFPLIKDRYGSMSKLPILQFPDSIRQADPDLKFKPHYRFKNAEFVLQIGPNILVLSSPNYSGWRRFVSELELVLDPLDRIPLFQKIERIGLRYVNFFTKNIFDIAKAAVFLREKDLREEQVYLRTVARRDAFTTILQLANDATIADGSGKRTGSILDLDISIVSPKIAPTKDAIILQVKEAHHHSKDDFFGLLRDDYLKTLSPVYAEASR